MLHSKRKITNLVVLTLLANVFAIGAQLPAHASVAKAAATDPTYSISGVVSDGSGNPLQHISVDVLLVPDDGSDPTVVQTPMSDSSGGYTADGLAPGTYNLHISDQTSAQKQFRTVVDLTGLQIVDASLTDQNATLLDSGNISGTVTNSSGVLKTANVELRDEFGTSVDSTDVNNDGTFLFSKLVPGTYSLLVTAPLYQDLYKNDVVVSALSETTFNQPGDIELGIASGISGLLVDNHAQPIYNAKVELYCVDETDTRCKGLLPVDAVTTLVDGTYSLDGLAAGTYRLKFLGDQAFPAFSDFWYSSSAENTDTFNSSKTLTIKPGQRNVEVPVPNKPGQYKYPLINPAPVVCWAKVTGEIDNGPDPLGGATAALLTLDNQSVSSVQTDSDGKFSLYAPDGDYRVQISAPGFTTSYMAVNADGNGVTTRKASDALLVLYRNGEVSYQDSNPSASANLPATDLAATGGNLSVSVTDSSANQSVDGIATLYDKSGNQVAWQDTPDDNGNFTFKGIAAGTYGVSYESQGVVSKVFYGGTFSLDDPGTNFVPITNGKTVTISMTAIAAVNLKIYLTRPVSAAPSASATPYSSYVTVEVYDFNGTSWNLNSTLTQQGAIDPTTKNIIIPVSVGGQYRVHIVPDDSLVGAVWLGTNPSALSVVQASTVQIPKSAHDYVQNVSLSTSATNIVAILHNIFKINNVLTGLRNFSVEVTGTNNGKSIVIGSKDYASVGAGEKITMSFSQIPISYFPVTLTAKSVDTIYLPFTYTTDDLNQLTVDSLPDVLFESYSPAEIATLSGTVLGTDSQPKVGEDVNLVLDDGSTFLTSTTDSSGAYSFPDIPLGVHFQLGVTHSAAYVETSDNDGNLDFVAQSGQDLVIDLNEHIAATYSGNAYGPDLQPLPGAKINIWHLIDGVADFTADPDYVIFADAAGAWTFDGIVSSADIGSYAFQIDGNDSNSLPAFYSKACQTPSLDCSSVLSSDSQSIITTESNPEARSVILVAQQADTAPPTGVRWVTKPADMSTTSSITWSWAGADAVDSTSLDSQVVFASRKSSDNSVGPWAPAFAQAATNYTISTVVPGSTYCLSIRLVDQSNNASAYLAPSCTTVPLDDTKFTPLKKKDWKKSKAKDAYLGALSVVGKKSKSATLTAKGYKGATVCVLYAQDPGMGSFGIFIGKVKKGAPKVTAGKHTAGKSVCVAATIKASDTINVVVKKPGKGVEIDGFAVLPPTPKAPKS